MNKQMHGGYEGTRWLIAFCAALALLLVGMQTPAKAQGNDNGGPGQDRPFYGPIDQLPTDGLIGLWIVGGQSYTTTATTQFEADDGAFAVGVCAKVVSLPDGAVAKIETEPAGDCDGEGGGDNGGGGDDNGGPGDGMPFYGPIDQLPTDGLIGLWIVGGQSYTTTATTQFEADDGAFAVGVCAKVVSLPDGAVAKIETEPAGDCDGEGGGDNGGGGDDNGGPGDGMPFYGPIDQLPTDGLIGLWIVGGQSFTTTATTQFEADDGAFAVGVCAKVVSLPDGAVAKIETEPAGDCDGEDGDDHGGREIRGVVNARPEGVDVGPWVINGITYTATAETEIKAEFGPLIVGACVKGRLTNDNTNTLRELETKRGYHCTGGDAEHPEHPAEGHGQFFGAIVTLPAGFPTVLTGIWQVGNLTVTADANTEFKQENGLFALGAYVKVEFVVDGNGQFVATEIKSAITSAPGEDNGEDPTDEGKSYGVIDALPADGLLGSWQVSGLPYLVDAATQLHTEGVPFAVGQQVKVEYRLDGAGNRVATEIEQAHGDGGIMTPGDAKIVGYVETMPDATFIGDWQIAGGAFVADADTIFEEEHGLLADGAYVEVEYAIQNGVRLMRKVETRVPPGGGDDNTVGEIEDSGRSVALAAVSATTWRIGGQLYQLTPATQVGNNLASGQTVVVNSFVDAAGVQVATRISAVTLNSRLFLPLTTR